MVLELVAFEAYEVAPQGEVALLEFYSDAGCFERSATLVYDVLVIAEYAAVCYLAAGVKTVGYGLQQPVTPLSGDAVKVGCGGILQEGHSSEGFVVPVCHAVAQYYYVFHLFLLLRCVFVSMPRKSMPTT